MRASRFGLRQAQFLGLDPAFMVRIRRACQGTAYTFFIKSTKNIRIQISHAI